MELINDLGSDVALAILVNKRHTEKINSRETLSLISKINEILEPISARDHTYSSEPSEVINVMKKSH